MKKFFGSILRLGIGEAVARLSTFGLYAYISRVFGVELLGALALAQTIAAYVTLGTDQGLRLIGARLVAKDPGTAPAIIRHVFWKRIISCAICVSLASLYAMLGPVPKQARYYVLGFVLAVVPYAFSLDWLAWGLNRLGWLGAWRAIVGLLFACASIISVSLCGATLLPITLSNLGSVVVGAALLWFAWHYRWRLEPGTRVKVDTSLAEQFRWTAVLPLGMATILTLIFNNFDAIMLGAMSTIAELGRYSAAYKILFVIFGAYYLFTQSLYPKLARMKVGSRARYLFSSALVGVGFLGSCIAFVLAFWAGPILRMVYGSDLNAVHLLRTLCLAIPMDFCAAFIGIVFVSRGFDKVVLKCAGSAALSNVLVNLWLIPSFGAQGAAWGTLLSYLVLLCFLVACMIKQPIFAEEQGTCVPTEAVNSPA